MTCDYHSEDSLDCLDRLATPAEPTTRYDPTHVHDGEWCAKCVEHGRATPAEPEPDLRAALEELT